MADVEHVSCCCNGSNGRDGHTGPAGNNTCGDSRSTAEGVSAE
jgi:hypothetical protein